MTPFNWRVGLLQSWNSCGFKLPGIRDLLKAQPKIKENDAVAALAAKRIKVAPDLFYLFNGKVLGE
jgi:hypothetical protein